MEQTKICSHCGRELPLTEFHKSAKAKDGLQPYCKECKRETGRQYADRKRIATTFEAPTPTVAPSPIKMADIPTSLLAAELKRRPDFSLTEHFSPRQLINALYDIGYRGELKIMVEHTVKLSHE